MKPLFLLSVVLITACSLLPKPPLQITSWTPGTDTVSPVLESVSVTFNRLPDFTRTEKAFSITSEDIEPPGRFSWIETTIIYTPYNGFNASAEYEIKVTTEAEDSKGYSLDENFFETFRTGQIDDRPSIESCMPADEEILTDLLAKIEIRFDRSVNFESLLESFSIIPNVRGISELSDDGRTFNFSPAEKYVWGQEYIINLSHKLLSNTGYSLADEFSSGFTIGNDSQSPEIIFAGSEDESFILSPSPPENPAITVNSSWEKKTAIRISFSEEIETESAKSAVTIEPPIEFTASMDEDRSPADLLIHFNEYPAWHTLYRLAISTGLKDMQNNYLDNEQIYYIYIDGPGSSPPTIEHVDFIPDETDAVRIYDRNTPSAGNSNHNILDTSGGDALKNPFFFDYYFNLADGAELPFFEFIENFLISPDNSCISITYLDFQIFNPGEALTAAAFPLPEPDAEQAVLRLICSVTDKSTASGTILFRVYDELSDSLGNLMLEDWSREFFDEDN